MQEEILTNVTELNSKVKELNHEKKELIDTFVASSEKQEAEKIAKEVAKLSFAKELVVESTSGWEAVGKESNQELRVTVKIRSNEKEGNRYSSHITVKTLLIKKSQQLKTSEKKLKNQIDSLSKQISSENARLEKIGGLLANMDREERKARAVLVESKLRAMDGGDEMIEALMAGLPEV